MSDACRGSIAPMGGGVHIPAPRTVAVPEELIRALEESPEAAERFESMSYTHRREYAEWVGSAKKQETRDRRASRAVGMIAEGRAR